MARRIPPDRVSSSHTPLTSMRSDAVPPVVSGEGDHFAGAPSGRAPAPKAAFAFGPDVTPVKLEAHLQSVDDRAGIIAGLEGLLGNEHFSVKELAKRSNDDLGLLKLAVEKVSAQHKRSWFDPRVLLSPLFGGGQLESSLAKVNSRVSAAKEWPNVTAAKLKQAVKNSDVKAINKWVADGAKVDDALLFSAIDGNRPNDIIQALVNAGANVDARHVYFPSLTPIDYALTKPDKSAAKALINAGAKHVSPENLIMHASYNYDRDFLRFLFERMGKEEKAETLERLLPPLKTIYSGIYDEDSSNDFRLSLLELAGANQMLEYYPRRVSERKRDTLEPSLTAAQSEKTNRIVEELKKSKPNLNLIRKLGAYKLTTRDRITQMISKTGSADSDAQIIFQNSALLNYFQNSALHNQSLLEQAAIGGHGGAFKLLLELGADPNWALRSDGVTALHRFAKGGRSNTINMFLNAGAKVDQPDATGRTPLQIAVENDNIEAVTALLGAGANIKQVDATGRTPLHAAAKVGDVGALSMILKAGTDINQVDREGFSPLDDAAKMGRVDVVDLLLNRGARTNNNPTGDTFLHSLIQSGAEPRVDLIERWIRDGADVYSLNNDGWSIMDWIMGATTPASTFTEAQKKLLASTAMDAQRTQLKQAQKERAELGPSLLSVKTSPAPATEALEPKDAKQAWNDYLGVAEARLKALPSNPLEANLEPRSFLAFLENFDDLRSRLDPVSALLDNADLDPELRVRARSVKNEIEKTQTRIQNNPMPFWDVAIRQNNDAKAIGLILRATQPAKRKAEAQRALAFAARTRREDIGRDTYNALQALIDGGAQIHKKDAAGRTPFLAAAEAANGNALRALLRLGASPNDKNPAGDTALHLVMQSFSDSQTGNEKRSDAISTLVQAGVDLNAANAKGETVAHLIARSKAKEELLALLSSPAMKGLRFDLKDAAGKTGFDYAKASGDKGLLNALILAELKKPNPDLNLIRRAGTDNLNFASTGITVLESKNNDGWSIMDWLMGVTTPANTLSEAQQAVLVRAAMDARRHPI